MRRSERRWSKLPWLRWRRHWTAERWCGWWAVHHAGLLRHHKAARRRTVHGRCLRGRHHGHGTGVTGRLGDALRECLAVALPRTDADICEGIYLHLKAVRVAHGCFLVAVLRDTWVRPRKRAAQRSPQGLSCHETPGGLPVAQRTSAMATGIGRLAEGRSFLERVRVDRDR